MSVHREGIRRMGKVGKEIIEELEKSFQEPVISIIFRDGEELQRKDIQIIKQFLKGIRGVAATLILYGEGGDARCGKELASLLRGRFRRGLQVIIPRKVCSCFVFTLLVSNTIIISPRSYITPVDPFFKLNNIYYRACVHLNNNNDPRLKALARKYFHNTSKYVLGILEKPYSLIECPDDMNLKTIEHTVNLLLAPKHHHKNLFYKDIKKMKLIHILIKENSVIWKLIDTYYSDASIELQVSGKRFLMERRNQKVIS